MKPLGSLPGRRRSPCVPNKRAPFEEGKWSHHRDRHHHCHPPVIFTTTTAVTTTVIITVTITFLIIHLHWQKIIVRGSGSSVDKYNRQTPLICRVCCLVIGRGDACVIVNLIELVFSYLLVEESFFNCNSV